MSIMTRLGTILFWYLAKEFLLKFLFFFILLLGIVFLFDTVELIRRSSGHDNLGIGHILTLAFYKLPIVGQELIPFITLFSAIATFRGLSQKKELVTIRSAGLSVWQFTIPIIITTTLISLIYLVFIQPLSAASISRYEVLNNLYFGNGSRTATLIDDALWLRQDDDTGSFILKSDDINAEKWILRDVSVFFFDRDNNHNQRVDAQSVNLENDKWVLEQVTIHKKGEPSGFIPRLALKTTLTKDVIVNSFSNPMTMSFWQMPSFITSIAKTGLNTSEIYAHYYSLLSLPLMLIAMVLMSAAISLKTSRVSGLLPIIVGTLVFGFLAFFISGFLRALSLGHEIPIFLGIWSTPVLIILFAVTLLTRFEDG